MSPYIKPIDREPLLPRLQSLSKEIYTAGELAYAIFFLTKNFTMPDEFNYARAALAIGVLDTVKDEYRRMELDSYEDSKRISNGEV